MNSCLVQLTDQTQLTPWSKYKYIYSKTNTLNNTVKHIHWCVKINKDREESSRNKAIAMMRRKSPPSENILYSIENTVKHIHWCVVINKDKEESSRNN